MNIKMIRCCIILLMLTVGIYLPSSAQTFIPDARGYVTDPNFMTFIKEKKIQLVGTFDTLSVKPLVFVARVWKDNKSEYINNKGIIIQYSGGRQIDYAKYNKLVLENNRRLAKPVPLKVFNDGLKYGIKNSNDQIVIKPIYEKVDFLGFNGELDYGLISVQLEGKYGLLNHRGQQLIPTVYDFINSCNGCDVSNNLIKIQKDKKWGLATRKGEIIVPPMYYTVKPLTRKGQISIEVKTDQWQVKYGVIDSLGKEIFPPIYDAVDYISNINAFRILKVTDNSRKYGIANLSGKIILEPIYDDIGEFKNGLATVVLNGKYGIINQYGKNVLEPVYDHLLANFSPNIIIVKQGTYYGAIEVTKKVKIPLKYDRIYPGKNILFGKIGKQWYQIEQTGKERKLDFEIQALDTYYKQFRITKNNKQGLMDDTGKIIVAIKWDHIPDTFIGGVGIAKRDDKYYLVDFYGNEILKN